MKTTLSCVMLAIFLLMSTLALAADDTPSLVGKWSTESMGGLLLHGKQQGKTTHWEPKQKVLKGQIEFTSQEGRFVTGVYTSGRASEKFIAMLSADGKTLHAVDGDGVWDCVFVDRDTFELVYRHVKATDSVVALGVARRKK